MKKIFLPVFALAFALSAGAAVADDDDLSKAEEAKVKEILASIGCDGWEEVEKEDNGTIEVEDAKCKMGVMDIKLNNKMQIVLISRY